MKARAISGIGSSYLLAWLVTTGIGGGALLILIFVLLGGSALNKSTEHALSERLLLAQQQVAVLP